MPFHCVALIDSTGRMVWCDKIYPPYAAAGLTRDAIAAGSYYAWDFCDNPEDRRRVQNAVARCLQFAATATITFRESTFAGCTTWWQTEFSHTGIRGAEVCCLARHLPHDIRKLSARQKKILQLIGRGHTLREISEQIEIAVSTVQADLSTIKETVAADTLHDLVLAAERLGLNTC